MTKTPAKKPPSGARSKSKDAGGSARHSPPRGKLARRAAAEKVGPAKRVVASTAADGAGNGNSAVLVRIYRHGLGDCILVRLKRNDGSYFKLLIDCGVAVAQKKRCDGVDILSAVADIVKVTSGMIDVLAITHEHWDHVSGFVQAADEFKKLTVGEVWVAWTEDDSDELARTLRKERKAALAALTARAQAMNAAGRAEDALALSGIVGAFGASSKETTAQAFNKAKTSEAFAAPGDGGAPKPPRYWHPIDPPLVLNDPKVRIFALGPPHDAMLIRKTMPSRAHPETYEKKKSDGDALALAMDELALDGDEPPPFARTAMIPFEAARGMSFFQNHYFEATDSDWRRVDGDWVGSAEDLALALQNATNNTSLVLAIQLQDGRVLLFAGDAQVGNWLSWQDLRWSVDGTEETGPGLLKQTVLYKVGHHGSHNATLREKGLAQMRNLGWAIIPVDHEVALKMRWGDMPLEPLVEALGKAAQMGVLRTDKEPGKAMNGVTVDPLFFEIAV